jgi:hypothetical protein
MCTHFIDGTDAHPETSSSEYKSTNVAVLIESTLTLHLDPRPIVIGATIAAVPLVADVLVMLLPFSYALLLLLIPAFYALAGFTFDLVCHNYGKSKNA